MAFQPWAVEYQRSSLGFASCVSALVTPAAVNERRLKRPGQFHLHAGRGPLWAGPCPVWFFNSPLPGTARQEDPLRPAGSGPTRGVHSGRVGHFDMAFGEEEPCDWQRGAGDPTNSDSDTTLLCLNRRNFMHLDCPMPQPFPISSSSTFRTLHNMAGAGHPLHLPVPLLIQIKCLRTLLPYQSHHRKVRSGLFCPCRTCPSPRSWVVARE